MEEVRKTVQDCDGSKAPGPDGFTFTLYKKARSLIGNDISETVSDEFFKHGKLPEVISTSHVTLVPKKAQPTKFSDRAQTGQFDSWFAQNCW